MYKLEVADLTYYGVKFKRNGDKVYTYSRFIFNTKREAEEFSERFFNSEVVEFDLARLIKK